MPEFSEAYIQDVVSSCQDNAEAIACALHSLAGSSCQVEIGQLTDYSPNALDEAIDGPGLVIMFQVGERGAAFLVPQSLPLPGWCADPDAGQASQLQSLAADLAMVLVPPEFEARQATALAVNNLTAEVTASKPLPWAQSLELLVSIDDSSETIPTEKPATRILLVWPLANPPFPLDDGEFMESPTEVARARANPSRHLLKVPVPIVVRLAEKKIEVTQLLGLSPGALVAFNKPCDDPLDLYVNNHLYGRGEAVKIGEKFGLKINEVGVKRTREDPIVNG